MKTNRFFAIAALFCFAMSATSLKAQVDLTTNPASLLFGNLNLGVDARINNNFSLGATVGYRHGDVWGLADSRQTIPVTVTGNYYINPKHGTDGFYVNGFGRYTNRNLKVSYNGDDENEPVKGEFTRQQVGIGFGLGFKAVSSKGFVFDIGGGIGRAIYSHSSASYSDEDYNVPELFKTMGYLRVGLGYRFGMAKE